MRGIPFLKPGMDDVSIRMKLWVLVGVLAIPIVVLMAMQFVSLQDSANKASEERAGVEFETAALKLVHDLQLHRDHEMRVLRGNAATQASLDQTREAIDQDFADLRGKARAAGVGNEFEALQSQWTGFRDAQRTTALESFGAHTDLIVKSVMPLLWTGATRSDLLTDSKLSSRSVIQALLASLNMSEQIAQGRSMGHFLITENAGQAPTDAQGAQMARYLTAAGVYASDLRFHMDLAMSDDRGLAEELQPLLEKQAQTLANFSSFADANFVQAPVLEATRAEAFYLLGTSAVTATNELLTTAGSNLNDDFHSRSTSATREMRAVGGVGLFGIAVALVMAFVVSRSITRPVSRLAEVADRISLGELDVEIDVHGKNEVGQLAESLRRMQTSLRSAIERLRQRRAA